MKSKLRQQKLLERLNHDPEKKNRADFLITGRLLKLAHLKDPKNILLYYPVHGEADLTGIITSLKNKNLVLPRIKDKTSLSFHIIEGVADLKKGKFNLHEPKSHLKKVKLKDIDLILVPGIVFDYAGHRIGYGKGYYDRLLKEAKCPKIGIAYEFQLVKNIPAEAHDIPVDLILTEKRLIHAKPASILKKTAHVHESPKKL